MATVFANSSSFYSFNSVVNSSSSASLSSGQIAVIITSSPSSNPNITISTQAGPGALNCNNTQVALVFQQVSFNPNNL